MLPVFCKLLILGDSLVMGLGSFGINTKSLGVSGDTPAGVHQRLSASTETCPHGDMMLEIGVNIKYKPTLTIIRSVDMLLYTMRNAKGNQDKKIYLLGIPSCKGDQKIALLNWGYIQLVGDYYDTYFIPFPKHLQKYLSPDCVHLSPRGYLQWKTYLKTKIKSES